jgi:hypothetical protein
MTPLLSYASALNVENDLSAFWDEDTTYDELHPMENNTDATSTLETIFLFTVTSAK